MRIGHRFHALIPPREREFLAFIRRTGPNDTHDGDQAVNLAHVAHAAQARHRGRFDMMHRPCAATGDHFPDLRVLPRLPLTPSLSPSGGGGVRRTEPADRAVASWTAPVPWRFRLARLHCQSARRLAHSKTWRGLGQFMESLLPHLRMHWDHEPTPSPSREGN